jgi:uncharacterized membrane protein (DUF4010 family)
MPKYRSVVHGVASNQRIRKHIPIRMRFRTIALPTAARAPVANSNKSRGRKGAMRRPVSAKMVANSRA